MINCIHLAERNMITACSNFPSCRKPWMRIIQSSLKQIYLFFNFSFLRLAAAAAVVVVFHDKLKKISTRSITIVITMMMMFISWNLHSIYSVFLFFSLHLIWSGMPGSTITPSKQSKEWKTEMKIEEPKKHNRVIKKYRRQQRQRRRRQKSEREKNYFWSSNGLSDAASNGSGWSSSGNDGAAIDNTADICDATAAHSSSKFYAMCDVAKSTRAEATGARARGKAVDENWKFTFK